MGLGDLTRREFLQRSTGVLLAVPALGQAVENYAENIQLRMLMME